MKQLVKPAAIILAAIATTFSLPLLAAVKPAPHHLSIKAATPEESSFSIELNPQANRQVIFLTIINPGKKNLSVTLNGPGGYTLDNFYTGKKKNQLDKAYNFSEADEGVYTIEVSDGVSKIKKQIKLERISAESFHKLTVQ
jgi:hypothetical protein